jgi:hypothetical protein
MKTTGLSKVGIKNDGTGGKISQPFPFPYFIMESGSGSGIAMNGDENGIYGLRKRAGTEKFT